MFPPGTSIAQHCQNWSVDLLQSLLKNEGSATCQKELAIKIEVSVNVSEIISLSLCVQFL